MDVETPYPVIDLLPEQKEVADLGGTMRLGADPIKLHDGSRVREIYGEAVVYERHRHRYEVNNHYLPRLQAAGLTVSAWAKSETAGDLCEMIELPQHPWFFGCQYHPEFTSNPRRGHPLFVSFVNAALEHTQRGVDAAAAPVVKLVASV